jgi:hypothetical protein
VKQRKLSHRPAANCYLETLASLDAPQGCVHVVLKLSRGDFDHEAIVRVVPVELSNNART